MNNVTAAPRLADSFDPESSTTLFLLCSPQALVQQTTLRKALIHASAKRVLRLVAIDEAHLYAMHGRSFREDIRILSIVFFFYFIQRREAISPPSTCNDGDHDHPSSLIVVLSHES